MPPPSLACSSQPKPWWLSAPNTLLHRCPRLAAWGGWTSSSALLLTALAGARNCSPSEFACPAPCRARAKKPDLSRDLETYRGPVPLGLTGGLAHKGEQQPTRQQPGRYAVPARAHAVGGKPLHPEPAELGVSAGRLRTHLYSVRCKYHPLPGMASQDAGASRLQRQAAFGPPNDRHCGGERHPA